MRQPSLEERISNSINEAIAGITRAILQLIHAEIAAAQPLSASTKIGPRKHPEEVLLTKQQVAELLNISVRSVDNMIRRRTIPYYRLGKIIRFRRSQIFEDFDRNRLMHSRTSRH